MWVQFSLFCDPDWHLFVFVAILAQKKKLMLSETALHLLQTAVQELEVWKASSKQNGKRRLLAYVEMHHNCCKNIFATLPVCLIPYLFLRNEKSNLIRLILYLHFQNPPLKRMFFCILAMYMYRHKVCSRT